jgi:hypothetical protein
MPDLDNLLWIGCVAVELLLLGILITKRQYRAFPVFTVFVLWQVISDPLLFLVLRFNHGNLGYPYLQTYYSFAVFSDLLELGVLLEIAANVLRPAKRSLSGKLLYFLLGAMALIGVGSFFAATYAYEATFKHPHTIGVMDTTSAILRLITFLLVAGFSQVLGLNWKNHVLQLATGLAFFSVVRLTAELARSRLHAGPSYYSSYRGWGQFEVFGYLCTLSFWCYTFVRKEAPRKEFSPQMEKILVSISRSTKRQQAVLARTRDQ